MTDTNGPPPSPLEQFLAAVRVRITSDEGVSPRTFEVQGLPMTEEYFAAFCGVAGVAVTDVVAAVRGKQ